MRNCALILAATAVFSVAYCEVYFNEKFPSSEYSKFTSKKKIHFFPFHLDGWPYELMSEEGVTFCTA